MSIQGSLNSIMGSGFSLAAVLAGKKAVKGLEKKVETKTDEVSAEIRNVADRITPEMVRTRIMAAADKWDKEIRLENKKEGGTPASLASQDMLGRLRALSQGQLLAQQNSYRFNRLDEVDPTKYTYIVNRDREAGNTDKQRPIKPLSEKQAMSNAKSTEAKIKNQKRQIEEALGYGSQE